MGTNWRKLVRITEEGYNDNVTMVAIALFFAKHLSFAENPEKVFAAFEKQLGAQKSLSGELTGTGPGATFKSSFLLHKPRSFKVIDGQIDMFCNGMVQVNHLVAEKEFFSRHVSKQGFSPPYAALDAFFGKPTGSTAPYFFKKTEFQIQTVDGKTYAAKITHFESFERDDRMTYLIDVKTKQILGWDQVFGGTVMHYRFGNLRSNIDVPKNAFDWKPIAGVKERKGRS